MKLKLFIAIFTLGMVYCNSFSQEFKNDLTSVKTIDSQILGNEYSSDDASNATDRLVLKTAVDHISKNDKQFFSRKEWRKIKKQLLRNKKRISKSEDAIHTYKVLDTIYVDVKAYASNSSLSGW